MLIFFRACAVVLTVLTFAVAAGPVLKKASEQYDPVEKVCFFITFLFAVFGAVEAATLIITTG